MQNVKQSGGIPKPAEFSFPFNGDGT